MKFIGVVMFIGAVIVLSIDNPALVIAFTGYMILKDEIKKDKYGK